MAPLPEGDGAGFTGTQYGMRPAQKKVLRQLLIDLREIGITRLHLGDCIGADAQAYAIAKDLGFYLIGHPPTDPRKRAMLSYNETRDEFPFLVRNGHIVTECAYLVVTPHTTYHVKRSGTWATFRNAKRRGREGCVIDPYGTMRDISDVT